MKKIWNVLIITLLMITSIHLGIIKVNAAGSDEYAWVLAEVVDYDEKEEIAEYNKNHTSYSLEGGYARNNYTIITSYIGKTDTYPDPDMVHGESLTVQAIWSGPPKELKPNEPVTLTLSLAMLENTQSYFSEKVGRRSEGSG